MFKHDTMAQYVTDRAPALAPRTVWDRITWTLAAEVQDARERAMASLTRPVAPVIRISDERLARMTGNVPATTPTPA